ncbi:hypothetical protein KOI35_26305 [Actinoplanes bogorensis]|uniref:Uncharacterized protein n=1 Tax=Paractinoplanes bogorensis TaxID=1610840 RepID=A0ABS5YU97_9ACTN|nr:hypothetical protein [Actinoplanes bogorensis]MBU2667030.1 hypothetical protein [Actinoplanes bogorensis]
MPRTDERPAPPVTVGMVGPPGAGRTTLLLAALGAGAPAGRSVRLIAARATQRRELAGMWRLLTEREMFPAHSLFDGELALRIDVCGVPTPLVVHDLDAGGPAATDTVVVVLDGGVLGSWVAETGGVRGDPRTADTAKVQSRLGAGLVSGTLLTVARARREAGLAAPSIAVVMTKADAYGRAVGDDSGGPPLDHLRRVVPACFDASMLTMISAAAIRESPDGAVQPRGVLAPFAFAALVRLAGERLAARSDVNAALAGSLRPARRKDAAVARQQALVDIRGRADRLVAEVARGVVVRGDDEVAWSDVAGQTGR